ncbi:MAG: hypothetical protein GY847_04730 [Proteobacteria bacterium]|nr:hypothetical protein [Pseudomonadota bacterium]
MKRNAIWITIGTFCLLISAFTLAGCGSGGKSSGDLGSEGDSCTRTADCEGDLRCIDQVCVSGGDTDIDTDSDTDTDPDAGSSEEDFSDILFDPDTIVEVMIEMEPADWDAVRMQVRDLENFFGPDCLTEPFYSPFTFKPATVTVNDQVFEEVGVRKKGFLGSVNAEKPSLKISFDEYEEKQECFSLNRLTLNNNLQDSSHVRQCIAYGLFAAAGVPAPRCNFAHVTVNGQDLGLYTNLESIKKRFLARHFTGDNGRLYEGTFSDFHDEWMATFEPKTDEDDPDRSQLLAIKAALELTDDKLEAALSELVDIDHYIRHWAVESLVNHGDGYATNRNNYYIYFDPGTGLAEFMPWGTDQVFRSTKFGDGLTFVGSMLTRRLYGLPATQAKYVTIMRELLDTIWNEDELLAEIDRMEALITPIVEDDPNNKGGTLSEQIDAVKEYIQGRRAAFEPVLTNPPTFDEPLPPKPCEDNSGDCEDGDRLEKNSVTYICEDGKWVPQ